MTKKIKKWKNPLGLPITMDDLRKYKKAQA